MTRKLRVGPLTGLLATLVLLGLGAWLGSVLVISPQEAALEAAAPPPSTISAPVERRQVSQEVVVRGDAQPEAVVSVLGGSIPDGATIAVLSKPMASTGDELAAGSLVAEVSGRPVLLVEGAVPQYRPLGVGATGSDVAQLQSALTKLGIELTDASGTFGESTWAAVQQLYGKADASPPTGQSVPVGELLFLPSFPASVVEAKGRLGDPVEDCVLRVAAGEVRVSAAVPAAQRELVVAGDEVVISSELLGEEVTARVGGPVAGADGTPAVEFIPDEPLPASWAGQGVRVRVISASTAEEVLAVPVGALYLGGDGGAEVVVLTDSTVSPPTTRRVPVEVGVVGGGYAEVTPRDGGTLAVGDNVVLSGVPG